LPARVDLSAPGHLHGGPTTPVASLSTLLFKSICRTAPSKRRQGLEQLSLVSGTKEEKKENCDQMRVILVLNIQQCGNVIELAIWKMKLGNIHKRAKEKI